MEDEEEKSTQYGLVMPFVVCDNQGGPYESHSFVAGVRFGQWYEILKADPIQHSNYEPKELVPQLDLLAMDQGYEIESTPWPEDPNWVMVVMTRLER